MKNVLEYLEASADRYPSKKAAIDEKDSCTYQELVIRAKEIGSFVHARVAVRQPVVVFMEKSVEALQAFMGIVYSGNFYVLVDPTFPVERINQILSVLQPKLVITYEKHREKLSETQYDQSVYNVDEIACEIDEAGLAEVRAQAVDTDPLYCNFTSGSTGTPKGVLICHRSVIDFINVFTDTFSITSDDVLANQAPFDFDVSVKDIYSCLKMGATLVIIPKSYFMFPNSVVDMLDDNKVTVLVWAVSALCMLNRLHGLKYKVPSAIRMIMFSGELMPIKQLNQWRAYYPEATFVNLYGPTEITCNCTYYVLDREFEETEKLPIGKAFDNEKVFLLDDEGNEVTAPNVSGEICVAGTSLALGYYNNPEMTAKAFTPNPLNPYYPETIYHTGDLGYYTEEGVMYFAGRKDFQIKHMGHRIELEEIETVLGSSAKTEHVCCFFDDKKNKIVAYYVGDADKKELIDEMRAKVPDYMVPNVFIKVDVMPINKNGKTDRNLLKEQYYSAKEK